MKKLVAVLLTVVMAASCLVGCGSSKEESSAGETKTEEAAPAEEASEEAPAEEASGDVPFIGVAFGGLDAVPTVIMNYLTEKMDALGWKYEITNGDLDVNKYLSDIESLCQQDVDLIVTRVPNDTVNASVVPITDQYDVPLVFLATATEVEGYDYLGHISDPELIRGEPLGDWLVTYCEENSFEPKIAIVNGAKSIDSRGVCERSIDVTDKLDEAGITYEIVADVEADPAWAASGAMKMTEDWIQKYSTDEMNTILCWSDEMCVGVIQALQAAGKNPDDYLVLSYDGLEVIWDYVKEGWIDCSSALLLEQQADAVITFIQKYLDGNYNKDEDFQTYCYSIYLLDSTNIDSVMSGEKPETWDYADRMAEGN